MTGRATYSIGDLATAAGVSRRTLHFYVQRGLLPGPEGRGRGARYTDDHLARLLQIKSWQERGVPLDEIRERLEQPGKRPPPAASTAPGVRGGIPVPAAQAAPPADAVGTPPGAAWFRQPVVAGIELHVAADRPPLTARQLARLARAVVEILNNGGERE